MCVHKADITNKPNKGAIMNNDFTDNQPEYSQDYWDWRFMEYIHEHTIILELSESEIVELANEQTPINNKDYNEDKGA